MNILKKLINKLNGETRSIKDHETCQKHIKFNNKTLRAAVKEWLEDDKKAKASYGHISNWDTSEVTDMSEMFYRALEFNLDISSWNVSNVTDMSAMFNSAKAFNQPIGNWDVSKVTHTVRQFVGFASFPEYVE